VKKCLWIMILTLVLFLIAVQPGFADDRAKLLGIWKIVSYELEAQATGKREPVMGKNPAGYIIFTPEGRMMTIITGEGRQVPKTDQDRAGLLNSMSAYTGMYRIEGDKWITKVDVAWTPARVGTEQVRHFKIDGDRLQVLSEWAPSINRPELGMTRIIITWERAK
jgi:hypothetical protein